MEDSVSNLLGMVLGFLGLILSILVIALVVVWMNFKKENKETKEVEQNQMIGGSAKKEGNKSKQVKAPYSTASVYDFMQFDDIKDNMIIKKKNYKYLMVLGCQGVNYDLMSGVEKSSTEQGFLQFLNTLRYPIQIYIQTRSVNLNKSIEKYEQKVENVRKEFVNKQVAYNGIMNSENHTAEQKLEAKKEYIKARNLYEYGVDILKDTEKVNLNRNVLKKSYYVVLSYTVEDTDRGEYSEEELSAMAFSELYTKAISITSSLGVTGITSKVLDSVELAELLYISYNRDDSDLIEINKAIQAGYMEIYSTAKDVIQKKMEALEEAAAKKAMDVAEEAMFEAEKLIELENKEKSFDNAINVLANMIIDENKSLVGDDIAEKSKEIVKKRGRKKKTEGEING